MSPSASDVNYHPACPVNHPLDSSIKDFIARFFAISDTPGPAMTEQWVDFFRDDAMLVMGNDEATGKEEIWNLRLGMWKKVEARKHTVFKVFPGSFDSIVATHETEFMMFGKVTYRLKKAPAPGEERDATVSWAAHAKVKRDGLGSPWGFAFYKVYLQR
ncbi:hypothetical protein B0T25DRAFT_162285 [Lasiosphaeria hispida]|uniref:SnoaL-like domain-containing protein n=1 Tax=Lasiosphaeria hispida TaxID=260671 RepID=A0AAJ0MGB5_9PEZI|nr:hypothetical protein B0T25DRAFT_162285 [Lasiosphaeria hispida]